MRIPTSPSRSSTPRFASSREPATTTRACPTSRAEAGIASGTIYLYFKTKEEILVTLFREKWRSSLAFLRREIGEEREPEAKLRRLVRVHFTVLEQNPALAEVVQVELRQGHKFFRGASAHEVSAYFDLNRVHPGGGRWRPAASIPTAGEGGHQGAVRGHGPGGHVLGARQARLPAGRRGEAVATIFLKGVIRHGV